MVYAFWRYKRLYIPIAVLFSVLAIGTLGYMFFVNGDHNAVDSFYMTAITITTVGYGEIIDLSGNHLGRIFTVCIAMLGIGSITIFFSNLTALIVESNISDGWKVKKMTKRINKMVDHYIVCGLGRVGYNVISELAASKRECLLIDKDKKKGEVISKTYGVPFLVGDATNDEILELAGVARAKGIFAATDSDNSNLVISLAAKHLNPQIRVISRCEDPVDELKMKKAGADRVISPAYIGGSRMATEMVAPDITHFVEMMLSPRDKNALIEEVEVGESFNNKKLSDLPMSKFKQTVILSVRYKNQWTHNPKPNYKLKEGCHLIIMTNGDEREKLEKVVNKVKV